MLALALGGGGVRYAFANLIIQFAALAVLALQREAAFDFWRTAPLALRLLLAGTVLLPVLQLVPLPESLWGSLSGRDLVKQAFELTGRSGWAPASVDPIRTLVALTGLIVPFAIVSTGWSLDRSRLLLIGWIVVALGLANVLIGIAQVLPGGTSATLYADDNAANILSGTFANRNSTGLFLVAALSLAAILPFARTHPAVLPARIAICVLLVVAIVLTRSRSALVLAAIPLCLAGAQAIWWTRQTRQRDRESRKGGVWIAIGIVAIGAISLASVVAFAPGRVGDTIERFQASEDARQYIWEDAAFTASRYWPVGAGMGTFDEVFQVDESLENATVRRAGRAHNDYLEVAIEAGLPGLALIGLWLALVGWLAWRARRSPARWCAWAGASILLAIALQSITDYPLRNQAMLAVGAFALLLLVRFATESGEPEA